MSNIRKKLAIRHYRKKTGMTQMRLAEAAGLSVDSIRRWETGQREPRPSDIAQLCEALGISEAELMNGPAEDTWELRIIFDREKGVMDLTQNAASSATLEISEAGMGITLSGGFPLWEDDAKFDDLIEQLRKKREIGLRARKEGWKQ